MADIQRDRSPYLTELTKVPWPAPPLNLSFSHGYRDGVIDLYWDDPAILSLNSHFEILGVNIYRSFDSEYGPFHRINDLPVGATYWRDETDNVLEVEEDVSDNFTRFGLEGTASEVGPRYVFRTNHFPIVQAGSQATPAFAPMDVRVFVDGVEAKVLNLHGPSGEVELDIFTRGVSATQKLLPQVIPQAGSRVTCTYRWSRSLLKTSLFTRVFYRVAAVGYKVGCNPSLVQSSDLVETPIENAASTHTLEIEKLDGYWREAIRRNRWILEQGGERVKVFIHKTMGVSCPCIPDAHHKQPVGDCILCFGTGIVGGYEGPYDLIVAPDDSERRIAQSEMGRRKEHSYEVWTGPTPLLSQRDFIVKQNNDRYSIGGVRLPSNRGTVLQQHFTIGIFDGADIRSRVPVGNPVKYIASQFAPQGPEFSASAERTERPGIGDEREYRGRTLAWENSNYLCPPEP